MSTPYFSFIIPVYNVETYISECVESVLKQNFENFEIILIDDGSTDNSKKICTSFTDKRILFVSKQNEGLSETRNKGIDLASGKYIIFLDSDDYINKEKSTLSTLYLLLKEKEPDIFLFNLTRFQMLENNGIFIEPTKKYDGATTSSDLRYIFNRRLYVATACDKVIKKEFIDKNQIRFLKGFLSEDVKWSGDLLKFSNSILFSPIDFYFYRQNRYGSITYKTSRKNIIDIYTQLNKHAESTDKGKLNTNIYENEFYAFYYLSCIKQMCEHEEFETEEIYIKMSPMIFYLKYSNEKRIILFRAFVAVFGFKNTLKFFHLIWKP